MEGLNPKNIKGSGSPEGSSFNWHEIWEDRSGSTFFTSVVTVL